MIFRNFRKNQESKGIGCGKEILLMPKLKILAIGFGLMVMPIAVVRTNLVFVKRKNMRKTHPRRKKHREGE
ncbi:MAG TPA: hypothetical protein VK010_02555 [Flavobacteriaceae bacterium]|nr:hypothetical protein [Flavobacteriaceae bacterium]